MVGDPMASGLSCILYGRTIHFLGDRKAIWSPMVVVTGCPYAHTKYINMGGHGGHRRLPRDTPRLTTAAACKIVFCEVQTYLLLETGRAIAPGGCTWPLLAFFVFRSRWPATATPAARIRVAARRSHAGAVADALRGAAPPTACASAAPSGRAQPPRGSRSSSSG